MKKLITFINEASLGRVHQHTQGRSLGMISASRGIDKEASEHEKNLQRKVDNENHDKLKSDLKNSGFGFIHVKGRYVENYGTPQSKNVDEHSFIVVGKKGNDKDKLLQFLKQHGEKYGQDSILHKRHDEEDAKLHGTSDTFKDFNGEPLGKGGTTSVGKWHPDRAGEFHSAMKGKTFNFESVNYDETVLEKLEFLKMGVGQGFFRRGKHYDEETEF